MNFCARRFNLYLLLTAVLVLAAGCATDKKKDQIATVRVHIESTANGPEDNHPISVLRSKPVQVPIAPDPFLTEANVVAAKVLETPGGFSLQIQFDGTGTFILEQYSSANPGRHLAIFCQWGAKPFKTRWLAAPLITRRIANGQISFTPDASRDEVNQLTQGLNNVGKKNVKSSAK